MLNVRRIDASSVLLFRLSCREALCKQTAFEGSLQTDTLRENLQEMNIGLDDLHLCLRCRPYLKAKYEAHKPTIQSLQSRGMKRPGNVSRGVV